MVQGQVFAKSRGGERGERGLALFLFSFFKVYQLTFRNYFTYCEIVLCI